MISPHADDVIVYFSKAVYVYSEDAGTGTVCVAKAGVTNETVPVKIHGGEAL